LQKTLNIDSYKAGYSTEHISCFDLTIGGAAGFYNYDNYFFYNFYYIFLKNWSKLNENTWIELRNVALKRLGLTIKDVYINNREELFSNIENLLNSKKPVIIIVNYSALFYYHEYKSDVSLEHAILINDYNSHNATFGIAETLFTKQLFNGRAEPFIRLQITKEMLYSIWKKSNQIFKNETSDFFNHIYYIDKIGVPSIASYDDLINDFISNLNFENDAFIDFIKNFNKNYYETMLLEDMQRRTRREFVNSCIVLFDIFEKSLETLKVNEENQNEFYNFKNDYMNCRNNKYSTLLASVLRKKFLEKKQISNMISELIKMNNELYNLIRKYYNLQKDNKNIYIYLDLTNQFNCQAFGNQISLDCKAKFTHTGTYLLNEGLPDNNWVVGKMSFKFPIMIPEIKTDKTTRIS